MTVRRALTIRIAGAFLAKAGKVAAIVPPAMMMLLSTTMHSPAIAQSSGRAPKGNNGVGKRDWTRSLPGNPPINDGPGTGPGNPGARGRKG